jgi:hypothetical protein
MPIHATSISFDKNRGRGREARLATGTSGAVGDNASDERRSIPGRRDPSFCERMTVKIHI